jgi:hypothetical protein
MFFMVFSVEIKTVGGGEPRVLLGKVPEGRSELRAAR